MDGAVDASGVQPAAQLQSASQARGAARGTALRKRDGVFDIVTFRIELADADGVAAVSTNAFIFPRRDA